MLGILRKTIPWQWGAKGKHPVARDFISIGEHSEQMDKLGAIVEGAFSVIGEKSTENHSWRFFIKGGKKDFITFGILKDSHDALGRQFPLIVAGSGHIDGWEERWEDVFLCFAPQYAQIEYLCTRRFSSLDELKTAISRLAEPVLSSCESSSSQIPKEAFNRDEGPILLSDGDDEHLSGQVRNLLLTFRRADRGIPEAVFVGGTEFSSWLSVFREKLLVNDVERLWARS